MLFRSPLAELDPVGQGFVVGILVNAFLLVGISLLVRARGSDAEQADAFVLGAEPEQPQRQAPADAINASTVDQGLQPPTIEREVLPADILPTSHWNIAQVKRSVLLNTQYGTQAHVQVTPMGREPVKTASGATIEAMRYHYTGDIRMDQWFDDRGRWVKGMFAAPDGSTIDYVLQE